MNSATTERLKSLLNPPANPCVSIYLATHAAAHPDARQDHTLFDQCLAEVRRSLDAAGQATVAAPIVERLEGLRADAPFWAGATSGLALFASGDFFETHWLPRAPETLVVVADSFHLKPLLRVTQSADRFHVLVLTRTSARLFAGDRYQLARADRPGDFPEFGDAVGLTTPKDRQAPGNGGGGPLGRNEISHDLDKYFSVIAKLVREKFSNPAGVPLLLAATPDNASEFRKHAHNNQLLAEGITKDPGSMSLHEIREAAWEVLKPRYAEKLEALKDGYHVALARGMAAGDPVAVGAAVAQARVGLLLVDADKVLPGTLDADGTVTPAAADAPGVDDVLDDLAERVLQTGGEVVVVPADRMPTDTGVAAVFRY